MQTLINSGKNWEKSGAMETTEANEEWPGAGIDETDDINLTQQFSIES